MFNLENAPLAELQFQSYSRMKPNGTKETWDELCNRILYAPQTGLFAIGKFNFKQRKIVEKNVRQLVASGSARFNWCGGTAWLNNPHNWHGVFNCVSRNIRSLKDFGICMDLSMQGCGVGAILEPKYIQQLPPVTTQLSVTLVSKIGDYEYRSKNTVIRREVSQCYISVGDSREGWVQAYQQLIDLACDPNNPKVLLCLIDLGNIRPKNSPIAGFGGVANPEKLPGLFSKVAKVLNGGLVKL